MLKLPGPTLRTALRDTHRLTATTVCGARGAGHLMIGMIRTLAADIDALAPESAVAVADSVTQILIAGLSALPAARRPALSNLTALHREQIKACVRAQLREPGLSVARIAAQLRLSPSTLHRAWAGEPCSLADWIWSQRLDAARRDLCDPALAARSVSEIAFSWGFNDAAHFSRAFRARFGCSPRALRAQADLRAEPLASQPGNPHRQLREAAHEGRAHAHRLADHLDHREALQDLLPQDAQLQLGQAVADAAVDAEAEGQVLARPRAVDDEAVRRHRSPLVAVAREVPHHHLVALA